MQEKPSDYLSYLLRLWRVDSGKEPSDTLVRPVWRASLESLLDGERQGFPNLDALFRFLQEQTGVMVEKDGDRVKSDEQRQAQQ